MNLVELHKKAGEKVKEAISGIKHDQWEKVSDCPDWTLRDLVNHIVSENLWVPELMEGKTIDEIGDKFEGDCLGRYPLEAFDKSQRAADEAISKPGALKKIVHLSYGDIPAEVYIGHRLDDLVVHGWDILKYSGQEDELDQELVEGLWEIMEPQFGGMQGSGMFGSPVNVSKDGSLQDKLLGALGRRR